MKIIVFDHFNAEGFDEAKKIRKKYHDRFKCSDLDNKSKNCLLEYYRAAQSYVVLHFKTNETNLKYLKCEAMRTGLSLK